VRQPISATSLLHCVRTFFSLLLEIRRSWQDIDKETPTFSEPLCAENYTCDFAFPCYQPLNGNRSVVVRESLEFGFTPAKAVYIYYGAVKKVTIPTRRRANQSTYRVLIIAD
jgi:hypothetical protein